MKHNTKYIKEAKVIAQLPKPDTNADKSGTDKDADKTVEKDESGKFDKPARETDPDKTGIDKESDKTKKYRLAFNSSKK
jgi:hypothetical protein